MLWAFAKLEQPVPLFMERAGQEVVRRLSSFNARDLSEVVWAYARQRHMDSAAIAHAVASRAEHILQTGGGCSHLRWTERHACFIGWRQCFCRAGSVLSWRKGSWESGAWGALC
jgi:hypothetical protein